MASARFGVRGEGKHAARSRAAFLAALLATAALGMAAPPSARAGGEAGAPLLVPDRIKADTLVVLAHPDDEGVVAPLVARYALGEHQRVVHIYMTSGEMGTNRVGNVRGKALGELRLTELHWTLDRLGVAMFHTLGRKDVADATSPSAVLADWGREETVGELVRALRLMRPDRVLAWFPGPASMHPAHTAAGAAALLACRAAADPSAYPGQIDKEGLRPFEVPEVWLFGQPEKVSYERYPSEAGVSEEAAANVRTIPVAVRDERTGVRYTDIAREAMREQRTIAAVTFTARGGPWEAPLNLMRPWGGEEPGVPSPGAIGPPVLDVSYAPSASQAFLEDLAREVDAPRLTGFFDPEVDLPPGGAASAGATITNASETAMRGTAELVLPDGWKTREGTQDLSLRPGEARKIAWEIASRPSGGPLRVRAELKLRWKGREGDEIVSRFVLKVMPLP